MINPANNRSCIDINECEMWDECDQICVNTINSYKCQCNSNYTLLPNGYCRSLTSNEAKVIFSTGSKLYETDLNGQNMKLIFNQNNYDITSFDYNYNKKFFFLTDELNNKVLIFKKNYSLFCLIFAFILHFI